MKKLKFVFGICLILFFIVLYFKYGVQYFSLQNIILMKAQLAENYRLNPNLFVVKFFLLYILLAAFSIPALTLFAITAGAIFGFFKAFIIVSFASTIGASFAFLISRYFFRDLIQEKFSSVFTRINNGLATNGNWYLFSLRVAPIFPYFIINILMGVTNISVFSFYWVSQLGMIFGTAIYVNAGVELGRLQSMQDILNLKLILGLLLIALTPLMARYLSKRLLETN